MTDAKGRETIEVNEEPPNIFVRLLSELMSNKHRGYAGMRAGGGVGPVFGIGTEQGGNLPGERFNTEYTPEELAAIIHDGMFGGNSFSVRAEGPFNGYTLPAHIFQASQDTFPALGVTDTPMPRRIVNAHPMRLDIMIKCTALTNGNVYIGSSETLTAGNGYPLTLGEVITLPTRSEVWAISTSTAQASVAMLSTLREG